MDGRPKLQTDRCLTGEVDEYRDAAGALGYMVTMMIRDFEAGGGDLKQPLEIRFRHEPETEGRVSKPRLCGHLHGWGMNRSSSSATTASSAS